MATIKSYTDLQQSKKLATILPIESADMEYLAIKETVKLIAGVPFVKDDSEVEDSAFSHIYNRIDCWSLTTLFRFLPFHIISKNERYGFDMGKGLDRNGETYMIRYNIFSTDICLYKTDYYNNPVDAAYEMILKLHEEDLL